jgi:Ulp1 protease family, C-terminal catalytic domain
VKFFTETPIGTVVLHIYDGSAKVEDLLEFPGSGWLSDSSIDAGIAAINSTWADQRPRRVLVYGTPMSHSLQRADPNSNHSFDCFNKIAEALEEHPEVDTVCFPYFENRHWYAIFVCISDHKVLFAEGFNHMPTPTCLRPYLEILIKFALIPRGPPPATQWIIEPFQGPTQRDGTSCGPIVLYLLDWILSGRPHGDWKDWDAQSPEKHRIEMLRRILQLHRGEIPLCVCAPPQKFALV